MGLNELVYRISRPLGGLQLARYLARRHPRILMYHRISSDGKNGSISVDQFREQVQLIRQAFNPMTMSQLMTEADRGQLPEHAVVVTFDDGYHDFADYAFPILKEEKVPATLFITTGFINGDLWLWPDQIRYIVENSAIDKLFLRETSTNIDVANDPVGAWNHIADYCLTLANDEKLRYIDKVRDQLGVGLPKDVPPPYRPLSWQQIREMMDDGLEVGCHSYTHPILTKLNSVELKKEIDNSRELIVRRLNVIPAAFCYPNGQPYDFDQKVIDSIRLAGYEYAVAAYPGENPLSDRWAIKRYPANQSRDAFEKTLYGMTYLRMQA